PTCARPLAHRTAYPAAAGPAASAMTLPAAHPISFSGVVASFTDADPNGTATDYTTSINWGDGSGLDTSATVAYNSTTKVFEVTGAHTYAEEGSNAVTIVISDHGASDTAHSTANVADAGLTASPKTVTPTEGAPFTNVADAALVASLKALSGTEGTAVPPSTVVAHFADADPHGTATDYSATVDWKDGSTSAGVIVASSAGGFDVQAGHTYEEEGSYPIHVSIADLGGSTVGADGSVSVGDAALTASGKTLSGTEGAAIPVTTVVAHFTDADSHGALGDYTASIDWKDGTSSTGVIVASSAGGFDVQAGHTYEEEGSYAIHVSIADLGGSAATANDALTVNDAALNSGAVILPTTVVSTPTSVTATFTDGDPHGTASDYTATIDWGDSTATCTVTSSN